MLHHNPLLHEHMHCTTANAAAAVRTYITGTMLQPRHKQERLCSQKTKGVDLQRKRQSAC
jgi:hypothetical protein